MLTAPVQEIFYSIQGEGPWVGVPQVFIRFSGCQIACAYCDTPTQAGRRYGAATLWRRVRALSRVRPVHSFCLTGGEPLLHPEFLKEFLMLRPGKKPYVYLETNGILYHAFRAIRRRIDMVAMDIKLPSAARCGSYWREHECFLRLCRGMAVYVKCVITRGTTQRDIEQAAQLLRSVDRSIPLVLQPHAGEWGPCLREKILRFAARSGHYLDDVRVIPQLHNMLGVP